MRHELNGVESSSEKLDKKIQNFIQQKKDENLALKKLLAKLESSLPSKENRQPINSKN